MKSTKVICFSAAVILLGYAAPSAAELVYNHVKAERFADTVMKAAAEIMKKTNLESIHLPYFNVTVPKTNVLTREVNANLTGTLYGLSKIALESCVYIPGFSAATNLTVRCNLTVRNMEVFLSSYLRGDELSGKVKQIVLRTKIEGDGHITVDWQGRNGLRASVSGLSTPALKLTTSLTEGPLELNEARWQTFVKAVHSTLANSIHGILGGTYRHILDEATALRILPYFHI